MLGRSLACPRRGTMAPSPPPPRVPASATTIDGLDDGTIGEILLRLPSSASLARAVLACRRWGRIASSVLSGFRDRHPSSPFMGIFVSDGGHESLPRPFFLPACSDVPGSDIDAHRDIAAVTRKGDFTLARLDNGHRWRLRDCRNGVLLLSRDNHSSLWVYSPLSGGQPVPIQPRPDDANVEGEFLAHCLLDGTVPQCGQRLAVDCFRVVSVQQRRHRREFRAVEYDSGTREWKRHPWASPPLGNGKLPKWGLMPMYAASRIFWQYDDASLLVLNTRVMVFSLCHLPWKTISQGYSIGEIEDGTGSVQEKKDGKGYLVCLQGLVGWAAIPRLQVWELDADNALLEFNFKEEVPMIKVLGIPYSTRVCDVCTVTNGLAVLTYRRGPHWVVDLQKMSLLAKFKFSGWGYPYQMSWPPTTISGSTPPPQDTGIDLDDGSAMIQPVVTVISSDNSETTLGHLDEQMPSPSSCSNSLVVESEIISTTIVRKNNPTDQCQKSSMGQLATTGDKPLNKDASNCLQQGDLPRRPRRKEAAHPKGARTRSSHVVQCRNSSMGQPATTEKPLCKRNNLVRVNNLTDEEPGGQRKKLKTKATSNACPEELVQHIPSPSRGGTDGDQHSKLSSNNRMKDPPSSSVVDTTCSQNQYMDPHDVNEAGGDEAAPSENHHTLKSPVNRTKAVEVENSITHLNSAQHDLSEKASLDLDGDSARIEPVEMYPSHELTLQNAPAIPSVSWNVAIRIDKSETSNLQDNTTDGAEMFEPQNCDKAHQEVTCANNVSETDEEPGGQRKKLKTNETSNACPQELDQHISSPSSCSNPFVVESEIISTTIVRKNNLRVPCQKSSMGKLATTRYKPQNKDASICPQQGDPPRKPRWKEAAHPKGARRTRSSHVVQCQNSSMRRPATTEKPLCKRNNLVRVNNLTDEEPGGQWKKLKTKATSIACPEELVQHIRSPSSCNPTTVHQNNPTVPFGNISMRQKATTQHARNNNAKANLHVEDGNAMLECNSKGCKRMFPSMSNLTRHRREVHENGKCIPCGRCDKKFTRTETLKSHFERMHNSMATCQFKGCTEEFPDKHARKTHEKSNQHVDDGTKKIKCHFKGCPRKYPSMGKQNRHYKRVHNSQGVQ